MWQTCFRLRAHSKSGKAQRGLEGQEQRWQTIGLVGGHLMLLVAHTVGEDGNGMEIIRIVSARTADRKERKRYENQDY